MPKRKQRQLTLKQMRDMYQQVLKKTPPNAYKNDFAWLSKQVSNVNTNMEYHMVTNNITINNNYLSSPQSDGAVMTPNTAKRQKTVAAKTDGVPLSHFLTKTATYEDFRKGWKNTVGKADEQAKEQFVKAYLGNADGKQRFNSQAKLKERVEQTKKEAEDYSRELNIAFLDPTLQEKFNKIKKQLDDLYVENNFKRVVERVQGKHIIRDQVPLVYDKLTEYLSLQSKYLKEKCIFDKIDPFVFIYNLIRDKDETSYLRAEIIQLEDDIKKCPTSARFVQAKQEMVAELTAKRLQLRQKEMGGSSSTPIDV